jgi:methionine synthase II (cobalamin-independent)
MAYDPDVFATLSGAYPTSRPRDPSGRDDDALVSEVLAEQIEAGLGLLSDGAVRWPDPIERIGGALLAEHATRPRRDGPLTVDAWAATRDAAGGLPVKQVLVSPYTLGRRFATDPATRSDLTLAFADELAAELADLAALGCPFIQVDENAAVSIGADEAERALFRAAHARLLAGVVSLAHRPHLSLAVIGGNADAAGPETIFDPGYDSHLFDLIEGPDNWRLIRRAPLERGMILGVVDARTPAIDEAAIVVWAIGYAASGGRGETRIGIAPSGSLAGLSPADARSKIELLGHVVGLLEGRAEEPIAASLDPRSIDARSAALGRWQPRRERKRRGERSEPPST